MTYQIPTCGVDFKNFVPYDIDLKNAFNQKLQVERSNIEKNNCNCGSNITNLGYTADLSNCAECIGFTDSSWETKYPILAQTWGCDSCEKIVAPISYYNNVDVATPDQIKQYLTDSNYKSQVDNLWSTLKMCQQGQVVKKACVDNNIYTIKIIDFFFFY